MGRLRSWWIPFALVAIALPRASSAQSAIQYVYDDLGRLIGVVDPGGDTATYQYDAVGNILSTGRHSSTQVSIISFSGPIPFRWKWGRIPLGSGARLRACGPRFR